MTDKVAREVAENEFNRFITSMDIDADPEDMDDDDFKGFNAQKNRVVKAIQKGSLLINEDGEPVFTPQCVDNANPITFGEPSGGTIMAMDGKGKAVKDMFTVMGEITKTSAGYFGKMKMRDLKVCMAVATLFLG